MEIKNSDNDDKKSKKVQRNLGIETLRMFLCFRIVLLHYYSSKNVYILEMKKNRFQVACFLFISFYFLYPTVSQKNIKKFRIRLERLLIPYLIYPIINWVINNAMFLIIKFNRYNRLLTINDLKTQIIIGRGIYGIAALWFHFNLIIFTILFFISFSLLKKHDLLFFQIAAIISYNIQYSEINYVFFKHYSENIWMSIGNLIETLPIAIFSFSLAAIKFHEILLNNRKKCLFFSLVFLNFLSKYKVFAFLRGFSSTGIKQIFISLFLFSFFFLIPFEILNLKLLLFIKQITKYTQGIYCLHFIFQYYMRLKIEKNGSFLGCIALYIISYLISCIGYNSFSKSKLKLLFN
mgnify:CR=1 FL=1